METETAIDNPYWDAVRDLVGPHPYFAGGPPCVDWTRYDHVNKTIPIRRDEFVAQYAWTITTPRSVAFMAEHSRGRLIDPLAGTGYWAYLLDQAGVDVVAYDLHPPDGSQHNHYHKGQESHAPVMKGRAVETVTVHADRTLLLSWPPYDDSIGARTLRAYKGDRVIYIGEGSGGCCGTDALFDQLDDGWSEVASHAPVQWFGLHDYITVYDRKVTTDPTT